MIISTEYITKKIEYYDNPAISQSFLKRLVRTPLELKKEANEDLFFEEKKYFIIGDGVDTLLTGSKEDFDKLFYISTLENKPSDTIKSIIQQVFSCIEGEIKSITEYSDIILQSCNEHNYLPNWKDQTRINKICEFYEYWNELVNSRGKTILSLDEYNKILDIVDSFKTNEFTKQYFIENSENIEVLNQLPIYFTYEGVKMKSLLDKVIINHLDKTIQPLDIKTTGDYTKYFLKSIKRNNYGIQAATYMIAIEDYAIKNNLLDYTILPFKFIVESTIVVGEPMVYTIPPLTLSAYTEGRKSEDCDTFNIIGLKQLIERYKWYEENSYDKDIDYIISKGEKEVNI